MKFEEKKHAFGAEIQIVGAVFQNSATNTDFILYLPNESPAEITDLNIWGEEEWNKLLFQTDHLEREVIFKEPNGNIRKAILKKCERQISQIVSWAVYKRDNYRCRYCHKTGIPLTVDHIVLWEEGGPSIEQNLVACCKKCNRIRGNTPYEEWFFSNEYQQISINLPTEIRKQNVDLIQSLDSIPRKNHIKARLSSRDRRKKKRNSRR